MLSLPPCLQHFANLLPDYIALFCESPATRGGDTYLLDGHRLLEAMPAEQRQDCFRTRLECLDFEGRAGKHARWRSPLARRSRHGRLMMRCPIDTGPQTDPDGPDGGDRFSLIEQPVGDAAEAEARAGAAVLREFRRAALALEPNAQRFVLQRGECLLLDNVRTKFGDLGWVARMVSEMLVRTVPHAPRQGELCRRAKVVAGVDVDGSTGLQDAAHELPMLLRPRRGRHRERRAVAAVPPPGLDRLGPAGGAVVAGFIEHNCHTPTQPLQT